MKRIVSTLLIVISACMISNAQESTKPAIGIRAAWDLTSPATNLPNYNSGSGLSVGPILNIPIGKKVYIEPGVGFFYDTMDESYVQYVTNGQVYGPSGTIENIGLKIPIVAGYKFDIINQVAIALFTGPQINYNITMNSHLETNRIIKGEAKVDMFNVGWRQFDAQWLFGLRFAYMDNFFAEITGGAGITNILDTDKGNYKNKHLRKNQLSIGVGYMF